jgi:hypothetical protein
MITQLDTSKLDAKHKNLPFRSDLAQFVDDVALIKPRAKFAIDNDCLATDYVMNQATQQYDRVAVIYQVKVYEGGEQIGALSTFEEYRQGKKVQTYGVESFRIEKSRGNAERTTSMHKKVAIRNAKKFLIARGNDELAAQISNMVRDRVKSIAGNYENQVVWAAHQSSIVKDYVVASYHARLEGSGTVTLQANNTQYINNIKHCDERVAAYLEAQALQDMLEAKQGYGVQAYTDNSYAIYNFSNGDVIKYQHFDDIPQDISEKLAMFKLIQQNEPYAHLGVKILEHAFYIVDGKTKTAQ